MSFSDILPPQKAYEIRKDGTVYSKRAKKLVDVKQGRNDLPYIKYYIDGANKTRPLYKIIWTYFNGEIPFMHEVCYRDGDPWNCSLDNLYLNDLSEEFKPMERWPGLAISRDGVLLNMNTRGRIKAIMPPSRTRPEFSFRVDGQSRSMTVAVAVWETFMGKCDDAHLLAHKDGDVWNCSLDNLYMKERRPQYKRKVDEQTGRRYAPVIEEDGKEYMPIEYYIHMVDGVKGEKESGIPQHCRLGSY